MLGDAQERRRLIECERLAGSLDDRRLTEAHPFLDDSRVRREESGELVLRPQRQRPAKPDDFTLRFGAWRRAVETRVLLEREQRLPRVPHVQMSLPRPLDVLQLHATLDQ